VPASARALLSRFDEKAAHYESRVAKRKPRRTSDETIDAGSSKLSLRRARSRI
jgi:hypothetical protein